MRNSKSKFYVNLWGWADFIPNRPRTAIIEIISPKLPDQILTNFVVPRQKFPTQIDIVPKCGGIYSLGRSVLAGRLEAELVVQFEPPRRGGKNPPHGGALSDKAVIEEALNSTIDAKYTVEADNVNMCGADEGDLGEFRLTRRDARGDERFLALKCVLRQPGGREDRRIRLLRDYAASTLSSGSVDSLLAA